MGEANVCFQIDTDNREHFSSAIAFQAFRKQRDGFYEILRIWEENRLVPGWAFQIALGGKVRSVLTMHNDTTNYYHFAKLFKSQLLISCIQNGKQEDSPDDESLNFLKGLKDVNPEKLTQLRKRLVTPLPPKDTVSGPSFPGTQEFFKDFILHAFNPIFYAHLENCLVHEIMELNDTQFTNSEIEDSATVVDEQTQRTFCTCISSLRLLAKVLGLLVALPYRSESQPSKDVVAAQVEIRSKVLPSINLHICLQKAIMQGKLSLTVPWVVNYLAMMDSVSLRLPYYRQILEWLYYVYWTVNRRDSSKTADGLVSRRAALLLKSTLGWLFELPNFPKDQYLMWQKTCKTRELKCLQQFNKQFNQKITLSIESLTSVSSSECNLDKLDIIDDRVLRTCCPSVEPKAASAKPKNSNFNNNTKNKHIKPVSSQLHKHASSTSKKQLEIQLEEAFFHGQPASTRKTVDFVSERVASTCVKHICNTLLSSARESNLETFRKLLKEKRSKIKPKNNVDATTPTFINEFKSSIANETNALATTASKELKEECDKVIPSICDERVTKSVESLLAEDSLPQVKNMCIKIANRLSVERVNQWIQSHIVGGSLFVKDMELEMNRFLKNNSPVPSVQQREHNPQVASPTDMINKLRAAIWELMDNRGAELELARVISLLNGLCEALDERVDLLPGPEKILHTLSIDLALCLVAYRVDLFIDEIQEKLIRVWSMKSFKALEAESPILRLFSPRNIMLLAQPENVDVWPLFGKFLRLLLRKKLLSIDALSEQCVALFRQEWPVPLLKHLSKCLGEAIADYDTSDDQTEKIKYLLGWITETYREMECYEDYTD